MQTINEKPFKNQTSNDGNIFKLLEVIIANICGYANNYLTTVQHYVAHPAKKIIKFRQQINEGLARFMENHLFVLLTKHFGLYFEKFNFQQSFYLTAEIDTA